MLKSMRIVLVPVFQSNAFNTRNVMKIYFAAALILTLWFANVANAQPKCIAPTFTDGELANIIAHERSYRNDLPSPFPQYKVIVRREGCYYYYSELGIPDAISYTQIFVFDQYGRIVDVMTDPR